jgi:hypothetical protein
MRKGENMLQKFGSRFSNRRVYASVAAWIIILLFVLGCACPTEKDNTNVSSNIKKSDKRSDRDKDEDYDSKIKKSDKRSDRDKDKDYDSKQTINLLRETILDFNEAVQQEDFSDFISERCSKSFRQRYTPRDLEVAFAEFINQKEYVGLILSQVANTVPEYSERTFKNFGMDVWEVQGSFDTKPHKTYFNNQYVMENGEWKILLIGIVFK